MKKLSEHVNLTAEQRLNDGKKSSIPGNWTNIWRPGVLIFGDKWTLKHGEKPSGEWINVLLSFSDAQIAVGINRMRRDAEAKIKIGDEAWPPTPFEFACLCKTRPSLYFPENTSYRLPPPKVDKATKKKWSRKWKEMLS